MSLPVAPLALSGEDRAELERLARSGDPRLMERARIILAASSSPGQELGLPSRIQIGPTAIHLLPGAAP